MYNVNLTADLDLGDWHPQSDGTRLRDISYTLALNYSFGPKFTTSTEHHTYSKMGQPGLKHIVDSEVSMCTVMHPCIVKHQAFHLHWASSEMQQERL